MSKWRLLLLAPAALMLIGAGVFGGAILWLAAWPPSDPLTDFRGWLVVAGLIVGAAFLAFLALRKPGPHGPWLKAGMLPYPMNDEG